MWTKKTRALAVATSISLLVVAACATRISVSRDWDTAADLSELRTWSWVERSEVQWQSATVPFDSLLDARIRDAVDRELGERGFRRIETGEPDFFAAYHVAQATQVEARTLYRGSGHRHWGAGTWQDTQIRQFEQGSLILDVLDPATGNLWWRGVAQTRIRPRLSPEERTELVNRAVATLLAQFPPS
jgi:Domain of unknown function (DUF4136)